MLTKKARRYKGGEGFVRAMTEWDPQENGILLVPRGFPGWIARRALYLPTYVEELHAEQVLCPVFRGILAETIALASLKPQREGLHTILRELTDVFGSASCLSPGEVRAHMAKYPQAAFVLFNGAQGPLTVEEVEL